MADLGAATLGGDQLLLVPYQELVDEGYEAYLNQLTAQGYSLGDAILQTQFYRAQQQVHNLVLTIQAAQNAGQTAAVAPLQQQLSYWLQQMGTSTSQAHAAEAPGPLLTALDSFSDQAIAAGKSVGVAATQLVSALPYLLWALVILAAFYVWFVYLRPRSAA